VVEKIVVEESALENVITELFDMYLGDMRNKRLDETQAIDFLYRNSELVSKAILPITK
jgi:hypothetical protein